MVKRRNERQITKDDAEEEEEVTLSSNLGPNKKIASEDVMKKRKVVKARRPPLAANTSASTGGLFSNVQLKPDASKPLQFGEFATYSAPAQSIASFATVTSPAPATGATFNFGSTASSAPAPAASAPPAQRASVTTNATKNTRSKLKTDWNRAKRELDEAFEKHMSSNPRNISAAVEQYLQLCFAQDVAHAEEIQDAENQSDNASKPSTSTNVFATATRNAPVAPTNNTLNSAPSGNEESKEETKESGDVLGKVSDPDWDCISEFDPVLVYRFDKDNAPKRFAKGELALDKHKQTGIYRFVMRDETVGRVLVNIRLDSFLQEQLSISIQTKKGKEYAHLFFPGCNDAERGVERFLVKAHKELGQSLYNKVKGITVT